MRIVPLLVLPVLFCACGSTSNVRQPSAAERKSIVAAIAGTYAYESLLTGEYRSQHIRVSHLRPTVVSIRISRHDPRFATAAVELRDERGRRRPGTAVVLMLETAAGWEEDSVATVLPRSCTDATPEPVRDLLCPDPWSILDYPPPRIQLNTSVEMPLRGYPDLTTIKWATATLPGEACGVVHPIRLRRPYGEAFVRSATNPWWPAVVVGSAWDHVSYGDLDGDGQDEAAVVVSCSNGGGTAAGQLSFAAVVFAVRGQLFREVARSIAVITPRQPLTPGAHPPLIDKVEILRRKAVVYEDWYGPHDSDCCASGRATSIWSYAHGSLHLTRTVVDVRPAD